LDLPKRYDLPTLRLILTVGEALPPDIFYWTKEAIGLYPHDTWWMTETGSICISNFPSVDLKPGSMGRVMPGIDALVVDEKGEALPPMSLGELALRAPWPSMLTGIFRDEERFKEYFRFEGLFLTGDMVVQDEEGYFYHHGRVDDIIKIGDRMLGPFDVENVLLSHPAISEAAVISKATLQKGTFMKAFVALKQGFSPSLRLGEELKAYARANLNLNLPLREVEFMERLPRTKAGKLLRRVLRAKELGIPISY
ncbi:MAG: acyl-CoA synthetase, partial [Desulfatiglandales bacterium]